MQHSAIVSHSVPSFYHSGWWGLAAWQCLQQFETEIHSVEPPLLVYAFHSQLEKRWNLWDQQWVTDDQPQGELWPSQQHSWPKYQWVKTCTHTNVCCVFTFFMLSIWSFSSSKAREFFCLNEAMAASWSFLSSSRLFFRVANSPSRWARISCWAWVDVSDSSSISRNFSSSYKNSVLMFRVWNQWTCDYNAYIICLSSKSVHLNFGFSLGLKIILSFLQLGLQLPVMLLSLSTRGCFFFSSTWGKTIHCHVFGHTVYTCTQY